MRLPWHTWNVVIYFGGEEQFNHLSVFSSAMMLKQMEMLLFFLLFFYYWKFHWRICSPDSRWVHVQWEPRTWKGLLLVFFRWLLQHTVHVCVCVCAWNLRWNSVWKRRCRAEVNEPSTPSLLLVVQAAACCVLPSINQQHLISETPL